ncbi:GFA family protein [Sphingomonas sp. ID1715]|uniref:GFA family protein n=1 Tax=Sphingomonas sp. ID1715 TaxID=1656898 RepID=UPI00148765D4|nr:GFA family protein [Sphingomonas sp. ID1715]NNM77438.1 GFA family protein [Sphingomonas sp. ID1715]
MADSEASGGCACGAVRFVATGAPLRAGLCHCMTCRKAHAAACNPFLVFRSEQVSVSGELKGWRSSPGYERLFCPACGARVIARDGGGEEVEVSLGSFDEPGLFTPEYELWITRREPWLAPLPVAQHQGNRPAA